MVNDTGAEGRRLLVRRIALPYAHALVIKSEGLQDCVLTPRQRQSLRGSMKEDLRKCSDALIPELVPYLISEQAAAAAADLGVNLTAETYASQAQFDPGRKLFHYEHYATLAFIVTRLEACSSAEAAIDVIEEFLQVAWILKAEDRRLTELGFRHLRPEPALAYQTAGIVLSAT